MSEVKVNKISPRSGTAFTLGDSGDTFTVPTGAGLTVTDEVKTNKISPATGTAFTLGDSGDTFTIPAGATITNSGTATGFGGGKINQVVTTTKTDTWSQSTSGNTFYNPTGFSRTITPTATSSKILIMTTASFSGTTNYEMAGKLIRTVGGSDTELLIGDAAGSRARTFMSKRTNEAQDFANFSMTFLDSPSTTSEITYKVMGATESSATLYLNRGANDTDNSGEWRAASNIVCMEVLA
jgi:hypothetical protein